MSAAKLKCLFDFGHNAEDVFEGGLENLDGAIDLVWLL
jgi:hypothetical protein